LPNIRGCHLTQKNWQKWLAIPHPLRFPTQLAQSFSSILCFIMANIKSVAKRARQSVKRHARNTSVISRVKSAQKKVRTALSSGDTASATAAYNELASVVDRAAKRGVIHPNAADRNKSRLRKAVVRLAQPVAA
jgi:small subunit ribosomal protein S20